MPDRDVPCFSQWNPSVEYQAMDRIHRLGQKRPVKVIKLVIEDSIEDQIVQLQAKKLAMTEAALSSDSDSALGKLTVEDVSLGSLNDDMWRRLTLHSIAWVLVQVVEGLFVEILHVFIDIDFLFRCRHVGMLLHDCDTFFCCPYEIPCSRFCDLLIS